MSEVPLYTTIHARDCAGHALDLICALIVLVRDVLMHAASELETIRDLVYHSTLGLRVIKKKTIRDEPDSRCLSDFPQVDMPGFQDNPVNFGAGNTQSLSPNRLRRVLGQEGENLD